ncbi:MAG: trehalose-6-phosphate synthase [Candidatus Berkelbacteria bacterium]
MANNTWNDSTIDKILKDNFLDYSFIIASNRQPYLHTFDDKGKVVCKTTVDGISMVFDSIMRKNQGTWVSYGGSVADKLAVDSKDHVMVPPQKPRYTLRRIWMSEEERLGYHKGFSSSTLYFLSLNVFIMPKFSESDWKNYKKVNRRFANAIYQEVGDKNALVWLQDYHLSLTAKFLREKSPKLSIGYFWHIPWPTYEVFRINPWGREVLEGMLGNDLIGFHRHQFVHNFLKCVSRMIEAQVDYETLTIKYRGRTIQVGTFPISVDYKGIETFVKNEKVNSSLIKKYIDKRCEILALGVDRLDPTKGIPKRLLAIERFLQKYPQYHNKFVYLGICAPSRTELEQYKELAEEVNEIAGRINKKFATDKWQPVYIVNKIVEHDEVLRLQYLADICLLTPLDDGMNLVAKEYVAANKGHGALILSKLVGAVDELKESYKVNPYDISEVARTIAEVIETNSEQKAKRMKSMKETVESRNLYRWAGKFLLEMARLKSTNKK